MKPVREGIPEFQGNHPTKALTARAFGDVLRACRNRAAVSQEQRGEGRAKELAEHLRRERIKF